MQEVRLGASVGMSRGEFFGSEAIDHSSRTGTVRGTIESSYPRSFLRVLVSQYTSGLETAAPSSRVSVGKTSRNWRGPYVFAQAEGG